MAIPTRRVLAILAVSLSVYSWLPATARGSDTGVDATNPAPSAFDREMALAKAAPDRDTRVMHLRNAVAARPGHPDNLAVEFRIGVELHQVYDRAFPNQKPRPAEALDVFESIISRYRPADYYSVEPAGSTESPIVLILASFGLDATLQPDVLTARDRLLTGMDAFRDLCLRRVGDIRKEPRPSLEPLASDFDPGAPRQRLARWEKRQLNAEKGEVLGNIEIAVAESMVSQFFDESAELPTPPAVSDVARQLEERYAGTPLATMATEYRDKRGRFAYLAKSAATGSSDSSVEAPSPR